VEKGLQRRGWGEDEGGKGGYPDTWGQVTCGPTCQGAAPEEWGVVVVLELYRCCVSGGR
jgi:hypothetical protein